MSVCVSVCLYMCVCVSCTHVYLYGTAVSVYMSVCLPEFSSGEDNYQHPYMVQQCNARVILKTLTKLSMDKYADKFILRHSNLNHEEQD